MQRVGLIIEETKPATVEVAPEGAAGESEATEEATVEVAPEEKKKSKK